MKIRAERKPLADAVAWVSQAVPRQPHVPALSGIRLRAEGKTLTLSAFDYDVSHEARLQVEVASEGECLVSAAFLKTIVTALTGVEVELALDGAALTIGSGRSTYRAQTLDLGDYPSLPDVPPTLGTVQAEELARAVTAAAPPVDDASPTEGVRGMHWEAEDDELHVLGVASSTVIHRTLPWPGAPLDVTAPSKPLLAAVGGLSGDVAIGVSDSAIGLSDAGRTVVIRILTTTFAKWRLAVRAPSDDRFSVTVDRDELIEVIKRAGLLTRDSKDGGKVLIGIDLDSIEITAEESSSGGSEVISAEADGREAIAFNPSILLPALAAMEPGAIRLGLGVRRSPDMGSFMTIRPADLAGNAEAIVAARRGGEVR